MKQRRTLYARCGFFAAVSVLYLLIFVFLTQSGLYRIENAHNDRLFSADDIYYVNSFFSVTPDASLRIIKHPLLIVFGWLCTLAERTLLGAVSLETHYCLIVGGQLLLTLAAVYVLDRIFETQYGLSCAHALLLCGIYALSFSVLFFTFIAESYALSALLLILSFFFARRENFPATVLLGALCAGVTVTNGVLWAAIVLFSGGTRKKRLAALVAGTGLFFALVALCPVRGVFFTKLVSGGLNSARNYSDHFGVFTALRYVFFAFFGSTGFVLHMQAQSPFGDFVGDAVSFVPSASWPVTLAAALFLSLLVWAAVGHRRDRLLYAPLAVLAVNLLLHGVVQYGLKEAFLYSLHHYPAQLLIVGLLLREKRTARPAAVLLRVYFLCLIVLNAQGYVNLFRLFRG